MPELEGVTKYDSTSTTSHGDVLLTYQNPDGNEREHYLEDIINAQNERIAALEMQADALVSSVDALIKRVNRMDGVGWPM